MMPLLISNQRESESQFASWSISGERRRWCSLALGAAAILVASLALLQPARAEEPLMPVVRLAQLEIETAQLESYKAELRREIEASIAREPGVRAIYAVSEEKHPERLHLMEVYESQAAYEAHIGSSHFLTYKAKTKSMIRSLRLVPAEPVLLGGKP